MATGDLVKYYQKVQQDVLDFQNGKPGAKFPGHPAGVAHKDNVNAAAQNNEQDLAYNRALYSAAVKIVAAATSDGAQQNFEKHFGSVNANGSRVSGKLDTDGDRTLNSGTMMFTKDQAVITGEDAAREYANALTYGAAVDQVYNQLKAGKKGDVSNFDALGKAVTEELKKEQPAYKRLAEHTSSYPSAEQFVAHYSDDYSGKLTSRLNVAAGGDKKDLPKDDKFVVPGAVEAPKEVKKPAEPVVKKPAGPIAKHPVHPTAAQPVASTGTSMGGYDLNNPDDPFHLKQEKPKYYPGTHMPVSEMPPYVAPAKPVAEHKKAKPGHVPYKDANKGERSFSNNEYTITRDDDTLFRIAKDNKELIAKVTAACDEIYGKGKISERDITLSAALIIAQKNGIQNPDEIPCCGKVLKMPEDGEIKIGIASMKAGILSDNKLSYSAEIKGQHVGNLISLVPNVLPDCSVTKNK